MLTATGIGYTDRESNLAGTPIYQWMICNTSDGIYTNIVGATGSTYTPQIGDVGKFIKVKVTPVALAGKSPGTPVTSAPTLSVLFGIPGEPIIGLDGTVLQLGEITVAFVNTGELGAGTWTSSNPDVATVEDFFFPGFIAVTAVGAGTTTIAYTTSASGKINSKTITVYAAATVTNPTIGTVQVGTGTVTPIGYTAPLAGQTIIWTSSDTGKATVDPTTGVISPVAAGAATISYKVTETSTGRIVAKGSKAVTVQAAPPQSGSPAFTAGTPATFGTQLTVGAGTLGITTNLTYTWYRSNDATYDSGTDTLVGTGTTYIPVEADVGKYLIVVATTPDRTGNGTVATAAVVAKALTFIGPVAEVSGIPTVTQIILVDYGPAFEYAIATINGVAQELVWQSSNVFTGLTPRTVYQFQVRIKETATTLAGIPGPPTPVPGISTAAPVSFSSLTANGTSGTVSTTELTLTFDTDPTSLTVDDIIVTGATKGALTGTGTTRTLTISNITVADGASVTVAIANPAGFTITPVSKDVTVYVDTTAPQVVSVDIRDGGNNIPAHYFSNVNDTVRIIFSEPMNTSKQSSVTVTSIDQLFKIEGFDSNQNFASKNVEIKFESDTTLLLKIIEVPILNPLTYGVLQGDIMTIENKDAVKDILVDLAGNSLSGIQNGTVTVGAF